MVLRFQFDVLSNQGHLRLFDILSLIPEFRLISEGGAVLKFVIALEDHPVLL